MDESVQRKVKEIKKRLKEQKFKARRALQYPTQRNFEEERQAYVRLIEALGG